MECQNCGKPTGPAFGLCKDCVEAQDLLAQQDPHKYEDQEDYRPRVFTRKDTGVAQTCRLDPKALAQFEDDPMTVHYGVDTGEFINDWRKKDIADGCPFCRQEVEDNLSEPDVMSRWGFRG